MQTHLRPTFGVQKLKLITNWRNAHKAWSVVLPTVASFIWLAITLIQNAKQAQLIDPAYAPYVEALIIPILAWVGRVIAQPQVQLNDSTPPEK